MKESLKAQHLELKAINFIQEKNLSFENNKELNVKAVEIQLSSLQNSKHENKILNEELSILEEELLALQVSNKLN